MRIWLLCTLGMLTGCATHYTWRASVPLSVPITRHCMTAALEAEKDVIDVIDTGQDRLAFRVRLPDVKREDSPSFSLNESDDRYGVPSLSLSTSYATGLFEPDDNAHLLPARALIATVAEACTGRRPTLGEPHPCGAGELQNLCVTGSH